MKKLGSMIITIGLILCSLMSGCSYYYNIDKKFISDGDFKYYYIEDENCYAIVGSNFEDDRENLYIPTHFRDKEIKYTNFSYSSYTGYTNQLCLDASTVTNLYLPYTMDSLYGRGDRFYWGYPERTYFANSKNYVGVVGTLEYSKSTAGYVTEKIFDEASKNFNHEINHKEIIGGYILKFFFRTSNQITIQKANTSYMYNYEGSPNEGYFFINDFERGGEIEDTPYEPTREGYTFGGWYKEPECKNVWDFDADTLPDAEYDEEGVLIFKETQLYAKWIKN